MDKLIRFAQPWLKSYDEHVPESLDYPPQTIDQLFLSSIEKYSENIFLNFREKSYTYQEIGDFVDVFKQYLLSTGVKNGDQIALVLPNIPQFVIAYYGILAAGGIVVAMNPRYTEDEYRTLFERVNIKKIICLDDRKNLFIRLCQDYSISEIIFVSAQRDEKIDCMDSIDQKEGIYLRQIILNEIENAQNTDKSNSPEDAAIFQFSGGTTGDPKAAIGMHKNIVANSIQFSRWCNLVEGQESVLAAIPLYHVYGMVLALNMGVAIGSKIVLIDNPSDIDYVLSQIETQKVTFYPGVPTMYFAINQNPKVKHKEYDLTSIKACISGSFSLHPQIKKDFEEITGGKLIEGYGLSEAPTATHCNPLFGVNKVGSIGLPLPDVEAKIVDIETGKKEMGVGQIGELIIRGPQIMQGYFQQEKETLSALRDGWLFTGDIAKMDEEGYFYLVDRKKSLIKVNGLQVWPNEVEKIIDSHSDVLESCVGGVPDSQHGERVVCWLVLNKDGIINPERLKEWCRGRISAYKIPDEFLIVDKLPRTSVGKILRRKLIAGYKNNADL